MVYHLPFGTTIPLDPRIRGRSSAPIHRSVLSMERHHVNLPVLTVHSECKWRVEVEIERNKLGRLNRRPSAKPKKKLLKRDGQGVPQRKGVLKCFNSEDSTTRPSYYHEVYSHLIGDPLDASHPIPSVVVHSHLKPYLFLVISPSPLVCLAMYLHTVVFLAAPLSPGTRWVRR
ncbi:hypothetical protein F5Y05DRAFT_36841 [Hypoxylon sp. FL0543]|nr:hypothetical protein F5Y05DRAFT_36841 [Hypoxylon sp. FL0543]